ncbi:MAG: MBL fold metallo-hydrolase [Candidatus Shapirobacteria bacterium]|jgi:glyoxylase-like metal-dependent hydrolase (beta-lactamase superfamily II)
MLKYEKLVLGELETNCYIVWDEETKEGVIIDPADAASEISDEVQRLNLKLLVILATHGHFDHLLAAMDLKLMYNIPIGVSKLDMFLLKRQKETAEHFLRHRVNTLDIAETDVDLTTAKNILIGEEKLRVFKTPGHTPGGVCFYDSGEKLLFSGDTLFADGGVGSTDHNYSSMSDLRKSLRELMELPGDTVVLPGHGEEDTILNSSRLLGNL